MFSPFCPVDIRVLNRTEGIQAVRDMLSGQKHRLLALVPRQLCGPLALSPFFTALQGDGHAVQLMTAVPANPSVSELRALLDELRQTAFIPTVILAIGGGSCMDLAKGVSALLHLPAQSTATDDGVRAVIRERAYAQEHPFVDIIAMPTTAGTGSEVTKWATIWDGDNRRKLSIDCEPCFAKAAVLIPEWTVGMSPALTLSTGLDALSHAAEAFWSVHRTPLSQALAFTAIQKVHDHLPQTLSNPSSLSLRREMALASLLAGLAFSQTRTTACHSISYPLTMLFGVPHGFAAALTLESVMLRNLISVPDIETISAIFDVDEGLGPWLKSVCRGIQPLCLSAFGIMESDLEPIADLTFTAGRMDNNPIAFTRDEVMDILRECL